MTELLIWLLRLLAGLLVLVTLLPLLRVGSKYVRCWDFPRLQIAVVCGGVAGAILAVNVLERSRPDLWILACLLVACGLWQLGHVLRYSRFWPEAVRPSQAGDLRLLVSNLDFRNQRHVEASHVLEELDPDVLLLIEIDDVWREALQDVRRHYPDRLEHVRGEGLGLALWSKWRIEDAAVEHLVSEKRASLHATLVSPDGLRVPFVGLHPPPPGWNERTANATTAGSAMPNSSKLPIESPRILRSLGSSRAISMMSRGRTPRASSSASAACSIRASADGS